MFFERIRSERQLEYVGSDRLSVRWYLGYDLHEPLPDHSSMTRIRDRYGITIFRRFFEAIVEQCQDDGLIWGKELYADATLVEANADRDKMLPRFASDVFPEVARPPRQRSILDPYVGELQAQWQAGCHDNRQLLQALRERGYGGSVRPLVQWTMLRRKLLLDARWPSGRRPARQVAVFVPPEQTTNRNGADAPLPASRRLVWLILPPDERLDDAAKELRACLCQVAELAVAQELTQQFRDMMRSRVPEALTAWLEACRSSDISELVAFAEGIEREEPIIRAALEAPYSNGVAEGHVNRLKMIKRTGYGRANLPESMDRGTSNDT